ncbi:MAG TPA: radical SAM protein [Geobacteraceae bacterium]
MNEKPTILFATPPVSREERYGSLADAGSAAPALGLLMLAAVVRQAGYRCSVVDAAALDLDAAAVLARIEALRPQFLGLTATTLAIVHAARLAERVKERLPEIRIIVGGPHVSAVPVETLERFPAFDAAVVGEGEETFLELLHTLTAGGAPDAVAGIVFRDGDGVHATPRRPYIRDLDTLPLPAWDLLEGFPRLYAPPVFKTPQLPAASLVTSRGCPNRCIFCDRSVFGASCHTYSADYVVTMIEQLHRDFGVREFAFEDDTFVTFRRRLTEICERLIARRIPISWSCLGRVNHVTAETLALMRRAGCWQVSYGIESGCEEILATIRKETTLDQVRQAVRLSRAAGLHTKGFFIVGHPGETHQTLARTIDFALELPLDDLSVTMLTPFPGTELFERAAEFGTLDPDWGRMSLLNTVFVPHGLTADDLVRAQAELIRRFYLRPRVVASYLGRALRNPAMIAGLGRTFLSFVRSIRT